MYPRSRRRCREAARSYNVEWGKNRERAGGRSAPEMVVITRGGHYSNNRIGDEQDPGGRACGKPQGDSVQPESLRHFILAQ